MTISIRDYQSADKPAIIDLLRLNTPEYFAASEEQELAYYLDHHARHYFVIECDGVMAGCGGFNFSDDGHTGKISWDIFHPDRQGQGLGRILLQYRIDRLRSYEAVKTIMVRTSQVAFRFYEKSGFELKEIVKDYWAPGFDLYQMELP